MKTLLMLFATVAQAGPTINGLEFQHVMSDDISHGQTWFSAEEGEGITRSARMEAGQRARHEAETNTDYCFTLMREAAQDGECSETFFAEDATCEQEKSTGCYENRFFRRKIQRLGFKVKKREMPTSDEDDQCAAISVYWCRDLRKARR